MQTGVMLSNRIGTFDVQSNAMEPTIRKGSTLALDRFSYGVNLLERWHVVLFVLSHTETDLIPAKLTDKDKDGKARELSRPHFPYIKRVVGLPGEAIKLTGDTIFCDGRPLLIPDDLQKCYRAFGDPAHFKFGAVEQKVPHDSIFVLSDNTATGIDSRHIGPVPLRCVFGRIVL